MVQGAKTIGEFKIMKFVEEQFVKGSIRIEFTGENDAVIYDRYGDMMAVKYDAQKDEIICRENDEKSAERSR